MKTTVTAIFPGGIGEVEISRERADQILRLQKIIREQSDKKPFKVIQSWRHCYNKRTTEIKSYPVFYVQQTEKGPTKRISFDAAVELIKKRSFKITWEFRSWLMDNGYELVVKDYLYA